MMKLQQGKYLIDLETLHHAVLIYEKEAAKWKAEEDKLKQEERDQEEILKEESENIKNDPDPEME